MKNKKGEQEVLEEVIFTVANIIFIVIFLLFVSRASSGAFALEQFHAKQIAIVLDNAYPNQVIKVDMTGASKVAEKNNVNLEKIVSIQDNEVIVKLSNSGGYSFPYFSDILVDKPAYEIKNPDANNKQIFLILNIGEKNE